jgi:hypothetical protein
MKPLSLFEVLSNNDRILVWSDADTETIYTWNKSLTLQAWVADHDSGVEVLGYVETDIRTLPSQPTTIKAARARALKWHEDRMRDA